MENQHRHIKGYRELSEREIQTMNTVKTEFARMRALARGLKLYDPRCTALAITKLEEAEMWLVRAIARPEEVEI